MSLFPRIALLLTLTILSAAGANAQKRHTISGSIKDNETGEDLIGATVIVTSLRTGVSTNSYGFYSLSLPKGDYTLLYSYMGYTSDQVNVSLSEDNTISIRLQPVANQMEEVVVAAQRLNSNVIQPEMSVEKLTAQTIKSIPALMGEVDVIKAIQLLPGVQSSSEGSTGFSVRGGNYDQNLILLDEATIYNASHLMGFFSVFNNDAIKDVKLYKGDIPAAFGGRLSSLLDIRTKDGNSRQFHGTGGIGLISSRLTLEGPIAKDKASFLLSGRRSYVELFKPFVGELRDKGLYFYDMNLKLNWSINDNNRIYVSGYLGQDDFYMEHAEMGFGNKTFSVRWNHVFNPKLFSNFTVVGSEYNYKIGASFSEQMSQKLRSRMNDYGFKADISYHSNSNNNIRFGYNMAYHVFIPRLGGGGSDNAIFDPNAFDAPKQHAIEHSGYLSNETNIAGRLILKYGVRYTAFQNIGNGEELDYLNGYEVEYTKLHRKGRVYNTRQSWEPRAGALFIIDQQNSIKASYTRTSQYIQLASNSAAGSPLDIWFQASQNVKPQLADQYAIGYFRNLHDNMYEISLEGFYKKLHNVVDFKDHAQMIFNDQIEQDLRFGKGESYGFEFMLRKNKGRLNGWLSYSYTRSSRRIDDVNEGKTYRSPFDKPVNISLVLNYELSKKWTISGNWICASGTPVTYPTGRYYINNNYVPIYSGRNEYRYPTYHRLDLSATLNLSKPGRKWKSDLNFSIYNAYGRKNPWMIYFSQEDDNPDVSYAEIMYLFTYVPSITWNFTF